MSYLMQILRGSTRQCNILRTSQQAQQFSFSHPPPIDNDQDTEPYIPPYTQKEGEPIHVLRARLLYQSRKRGMLENGLLLSTFAAKYLDSMTSSELKQYDRIINLPSNDWDIYYWATGVKPIPVEFDNDIMLKFVEHVQNVQKEPRFQQPDLKSE